MFIPCELIDGQSVAALNILNQCLEPIEGELDTYYTLFNKVSRNNGDFIDCGLLLKYLKVEDTLLSRRMLSFFDSSGSGQISFLEFSINLYNLLSMRTELLGSYVRTVCPAAALCPYRCLSHSLTYSLNPTPSHPIPSHPIPSHPIPSHPIPSHPIPSHPIPSQPAMQFYQLAEFVYKTEEEKASKDKTILSKHVLALFHSLEGTVLCHAVP